MFYTVASDLEAHALAPVDLVTQWCDIACLVRGNLPHLFEKSNKQHAQHDYPTHDAHDSVADSVGHGVEQSNTQTKDSHSIVLLLIGVRMEFGCSRWGYFSDRAGETIVGLKP